MSDPLDPDFTLAVHRDGEQLRVVPSGELDLATVPQVEAALRSSDDAASDVTLDLRGLKFMDTSGLRLVLEEERRAQSGGYTLRLVRGTRSVQRIFELAGIADRLPFVDPDDAG